MPTLESVEPVFAQAEGTSASCWPCIDHAHLHEIEFFVCACEPATGIIDMEFQIWYSCHIAEVLIERILRKEIDENGIELHSCDVGHPKKVSRHKVSTAANSNDGRFVDTWKAVCQTGQGVLQEPDGACTATIVRHDRACRAIDIQLLLHH